MPLTRIALITLGVVLAGVAMRAVPHTNRSEFVCGDPVPKCPYKVCAF